MAAMTVRCRREDEWKSLARPRRKAARKSDLWSFVEITYLVHGTYWCDGMKVGGWAGVYRDSVWFLGGSRNTAIPYAYIDNSS
jgi:hypothetical protein